MIRNTQDSWGFAAKFFHWATALLVFVQLPLGWMAVSWRLSPAKAHLYVWHKSLGMLLLVLVVLRLLWRFVNSTPALPADMPLWQCRSARTSYALLYALLIAMPLTGWILNSAANVPVHIFWLIPLPSIAAPSKNTASLAAFAHITMFVTLTALLMIHIAAALRHHFVSRNDVLVRMLPASGRRARSVALVAMLALVGVPRTAQAGDWSMERAASRLEFLVTFESAPAIGVFKQFDTHVNLEPERLHESRIDVKIATASADMMSAGFNTVIRTREWFDCAHFPYAEFHSIEVRRVGVDSYIAKGTLSLKGISRLVEVPFVWSEAASAAALRGELTVKRSDFRIGTGEWAGSDVVGAEVRVRFSLQLRKSS
jgi:cytochrome b561/polyisoprenoid-binding protein YceI